MREGRETETDRPACRYTYVYAYDGEETSYHRCMPNGDSFLFLSRCRNWTGETLVEIHGSFLVVFIKKSGDVYRRKMSRASVLTLYAGSKTVVCGTRDEISVRTCYRLHH